MGSWWVLLREGPTRTAWQRVKGQKDLVRKKAHFPYPRRGLVSASGSVWWLSLHVCQPANVCFSYDLGKLLNLSLLPAFSKVYAQWSQQYTIYTYMHICAYLLIHTYILFVFHMHRRRRETYFKKSVYALVGTAKSETAGQARDTLPFSSRNTVFPLKAFAWLGEAHLHYGR